MTDYTTENTPIGDVTFTVTVDGTPVARCTVSRQSAYPLEVRIRAILNNAQYGYCEASEAVAEVAKRGRLLPVTV